MSRAPRVPEWVRQKAASLGPEGEAGLAGLPAVIAHLEERRVSSGLYALSFGAEDLGRPFLATAERLVDGPVGTRCASEGSLLSFAPCESPFSSSVSR